MFVVALKRAGFAASWSRTASWEIPTLCFKMLSCKCKLLRIVESIDYMKFCAV
jgi:hypothetical protein